MRDIKLWPVSEYLKRVRQQQVEERASLSRYAIYNELKAVAIEPTAQPTMETRRQAARLFTDKVAQATAFKNSKVDAKREFFTQLWHATRIADYYGGCIRFPRNYHHPECSKMTLQVIDAAIQAGLYNECRSPKGSPKMSRLLPRGEAVAEGNRDPWEFDPQHPTQYVFLYDRETKREVPFDATHPVPAFVQQRLERINHINSLHTISYEMFDQWSEEFNEGRQLRPIHYARFSDSFDQHGRLYTGKYGHQALRKIERKTIRFDGEPCVEPDYSGMHPRLLYHLEDLVFPGDPYALWGKETTPQLRLMAKHIVNALINAKSPEAAVADCNQKLCTTTKPENKGDKRQRKRGKALALALQLQEAQATTGVSFKDASKQAMKFHARIAHRFGCDLGVTLMWLDSALALDILSHFAEQCIPCLSCHDSYIVPAFAANELRAAMRHYYELRTGHLPCIKG